MPDPDTLLAQVDSSVGGKTGVDLPEVKPRRRVLSATPGAHRPERARFLPDSTFADGMAEVVKYGYISNRKILTMVALPDYKANIENIIYECVKIKRDVVAIDEHDTGLRMILNFGHTIGHAAEKLGNYTDLTHGRRWRSVWWPRCGSALLGNRGSDRAAHRPVTAHRAADR